MLDITRKDRTWQNRKNRTGKDNTGQNRKTRTGKDKVRQDMAGHKRGQNSTG